MANLFPEIENNELDMIPEIDDSSIPNDLPEDLENINELQDEDHDFKTGDILNFMNDFSEEKEDMGIDQLPTNEEFTEVGKQTSPTATARKTGKFVSRMIDYGAATGLSIISGQPMSQHKADDEAYKELESIITEYIKESGGEIPLNIQLIICLVVTYGLQIPAAIQMRKQMKSQNNA